MRVYVESLIKHLIQIITLLNPWIIQSPSPLQILLSGGTIYDFTALSPGT